MVNLFGYNRTMVHQPRISMVFQSDRRQGPSNPVSDRPTSQTEHSMNPFYFDPNYGAVIGFFIASLIATLWWKRFGRFVVSRDTYSAYSSYVKSGLFVLTPVLITILTSVVHQSHPRLVLWISIDLTIVVTAYCAGIFYAEREETIKHNKIIIEKDNEIMKLSSAVTDEKQRSEIFKKRMEAKTGLQEIFAKFPSIEHRHLNTVLDEYNKTTKKQNSCCYYKKFLNPEINIEATIVGIFDFLRLSKIFESVNTPRVVLFEPINGYLSARKSFHNGSPNPVTSPNHRHKNYFLLDPLPSNGIAPSAAVHISISNQEIWICGNAELEDSNVNSSFNFFNDEQRNQIGSFFVFKAIAHGADKGVPTPVIMCDIPDKLYFNENDEFKNDILKQLASLVRDRLTYEFELHALCSIDCANSKSAPRRGTRRARLDQPEGPQGPKEPRAS